MEHESSDESDDENDESGDDSEEEALAEKRRVRYGMIFNFLAKNKTHEELVVIQQTMQQQCPELAQHFLEVQEAVERERDAAQTEAAQQ